VRSTSSATPASSAGTSVPLATSRAGQKLTEGASYVQDRLGAADETVRDYTGKPLDEWTEDLRAFMRERPLLGAAAMIAAGDMAAKFLPQRRYQ
jgi:hypothetical protein